MPQGNFSRPRDRASADQARVADGVVRRAERPRADEPARVVQDSGDAMDARGFDGFLERHGRKDRGDAFCEHRFSRAGRPDKNNVVAAGAGDFEGALGGLLPADVAHVHGVLRGVGQHRARVHAHRRERFRDVDEVHGLRQIAHGEYVDPLDDRGLARIGFRNDHGLDFVLARRQRRRERTAHRAHLAVERKLAKKNVLVEALAEERALTPENRKRHREIVGRSFLANVGGRQIDRDALKREVVAAIFQRRLDAFAALLHGDVRQADDVEIAGLPRTDVHLDLHEVGVDAKHRGAEVLEMHKSLKVTDSGGRKSNPNGISLPVKRVGVAQALACGG